MDPDRKRQILNAEERFILRERLNRALAEKGVYVVGRLTHDAPAVPESPHSGGQTPTDLSPGPGQAALPDGVADRPEP